MKRRVHVVALAIVAVLSLAACGSDSTGDTAQQSRLPEGCRLSPPEQLLPVVTGRIPHDSKSYVQGLLFVDDTLYESSGRYGESKLRALDPETGRVRSEVELPDDVFGEGLAATSRGELVQLTWKEGVAFRWPVGQIRRGGRPSGQLRYKGEGWGLTTLSDGELLMSDGSDRLSVRDPDDFRVLQTHTVQRLGGPSDQLNELEFDGESIWANRYQSTEVLRIDPKCWTVTGVADAESLRFEAAELAESRGEVIDVLNGIAAVPGTDTFLLSGKWWPRSFLVRFEPKA